MKEQFVSCQIYVYTTVYFNNLFSVTRIPTVFCCLKFLIFFNCTIIERVTQSTVSHGTFSVLCHMFGMTGSINKLPIIFLSTVLTQVTQKFSIEHDDTVSYIFERNQQVKIDENYN